MDSAKILVLLGVCSAVAGCGGGPSLESVTGGAKTTAPEITVQARNPLAIPPDLKLKEPPPAPITADVTGTGVDAGPALPGSFASTRRSGNISAGGAAGRAAVALPKQDVYAKYGISTTNPDGTPKSNDQLQAELKAAVMAKKREQNPGYGTIFNMGSIFHDG